MAARAKNVGRPGGIAAARLGGRCTHGTEEEEELQRRDGAECDASCDVNADIRLGGFRALVAGGVAGRGRWHLLSRTTLDSRQAERMEERTVMGDRLSLSLSS